MTILYTPLKRVVLWSHSKKLLGSIPALAFLHGACMFSLCLCEFSPERRLPPTIKEASQANWQLVMVRRCECFCFCPDVPPPVTVATCPGDAGRAGEVFSELALHRTSKWHVFKPLLQLQWVSLYTRSPVQTKQHVHLKAVVVEHFLPVTAGAIRHWCKRRSNETREEKCLQPTATMLCYFSCLPGLI